MEGDPIGQLDVVGSRRRLAAQHAEQSTMKKFWQAARGGVARMRSPLVLRWAKSSEFCRFVFGR
jgi:hypothetical protein